MPRARAEAGLRHRPRRPGSRTRVEAAVFPLVPRRRVIGLAFGGVRSARRGVGSDVASTREYRPGDDVAWMDWAARRGSPPRAAPTSSSSASASPTRLRASSCSPTAGRRWRSCVAAPELDKPQRDPHRPRADRRERPRRAQPHRLPRLRGGRAVLARASLGVARRARHVRAERSTRPATPSRGASTSSASTGATCRRRRSSSSSPTSSSRPTSRLAARARAPLGDRPGDDPGSGLGAELPAHRRHHRPVRRPARPAASYPVVLTEREAARAPRRSTRPAGTGSSAFRSLGIEPVSVHVARLRRRCSPPSCAGRTCARCGAEPSRERRSPRRRRPRLSRWRRRPLRAAASQGSSVGEGVPLKAYATITPTVHLFGDELTAKIAIVADTKWVDPARLRVRPNFAPYTLPRKPSVLRLGVGRFSQVTWTWTLRCITLPCVPRLPPSDKFHVFRFHPTRIDYVSSRASRLRHRRELPAGRGALAGEPGRRRVPAARRIALNWRFQLTPSRRRRTASRPRSSSGSPSALARRFAARRAPGSPSAGTSSSGRGARRRASTRARRSSARSRCCATRTRPATRRCSARRSSASPASSASSAPDELSRIARELAWSSGRRTTRRSRTFAEQARGRRTDEDVSFDARRSTDAAPSPLADLPGLHVPRARTSALRVVLALALAATLALLFVVAGSAAPDAPPSSPRDEHRHRRARHVGEHLRADLRARRDDAARDRRREPVDRPRDVLRHRLRAAAAELAARRAAAVHPVLHAAALLGEHAGVRPDAVGQLQRRHARRHGPRDGAQRAAARARASTARSSSSAISTTRTPTRRRSSSEALPLRTRHIPVRIVPLFATPHDRRSSPPSSATTRSSTRASSRTPRSGTQAFAAPQPWTLLAARRAARPPARRQRALERDASRSGATA